MKRTLVIFDVDGTLTDSNGVDGACYVAALEDALGLRLESPDWSPFADCTDAGIAAELFSRTHGRVLSDPELAEFAACFCERLQRTLQREPCAEIRGASALVGRIRAQEPWSACVATGAWRRSAELKLAAARVDVSGLAFASCDDAHSRRDIVRAAMRKAADLQAGGGFDACVAVGDGVWDLETAAALRIPFVGVARGDQAAALRSRGATVVFEDLSDAGAFLEAVARLTR
jgi:phosphoglycolate phosphatase-like HAD superfamily hydrolase